MCGGGGSPPPFPFPFPFPPCLRSRARFHLACVYSPSPLFAFPFRPRPHNLSRPRSRPRLRFRLRPRPRLRFPPKDPVRFFPPLGPSHPLGTASVYKHRALQTELSDARKHQLLFAKMMTHADKKCLLENKKRITAEDGILPSPPPDDGTH